MNLDIIFLKKKLNFEKWIQTPNRALGDKKPLELLDTLIFLFLLALLIFIHYFANVIYHSLDYHNDI